MGVAIGLICCDCITIESMMLVNMYYGYCTIVLVINNVNLSLSMLDFTSCLGGNGWIAKNSGGAEARKPEGQPDDTRHGKQKGSEKVVVLC